MRAERDHAAERVAPVSDGPARQSQTGATSHFALDRRQWRQLLMITIGAIAIYVTMRLLPTGTNLSHMDFRVQGGTSIEFCDAHNPQFIPVVAVRSPVTLTVSAAQAPTAGQPVHGLLTLRTFSGKPITPEDLLVVHEHPLHLMIVDPSLTDYQHVHPQPSGAKGEWSFSFTPRFGGTYRLFADFSPIATARGLYANADLNVNGTVAPPNALAERAAEGGRAPALVEQDGYRFALVANPLPIRVRRQIDLTFEAVAVNGGPVPMQPIMGAYAHVVAFDSGRSGFAHLHPNQANPLEPPDRFKPTLNFKLTIPSAGRYVIWAQVNLAGQEVFVPFWFTVSA